MSLRCAEGIRPARIEDIGAVSGLENLIFTSPWSEASLLSVLDEGYLFAVAERFSEIAEDEREKALVKNNGRSPGDLFSEIAGYAFLDVRSVHEAELLRIAVSPGSRGRGCAGALMEYLIDGARALGAERMLLEVRASNRAAIGLYKKYGFAGDGVRRGYYRFPTEDALLMSRTLLPCGQRGC